MRAEPPHGWFVPSTLSSPRLQEALRLALLELQEHWETFLDRRDHIKECVDGLKTTAKLQPLGENPADLGNEELMLDLSRALYKLLFLIQQDGARTCIKSSQLQDVSTEVAAGELFLSRVLDNCGDSDQGTPTPLPAPSPSPGSDEVETVLMELLQGEKWAAALRHIRHNRSVATSESICVQEDDITAILNMFCRHLTDNKTEMFVTKSEQNLADVFSRLMDSLYQVMGAIHALDHQVKQQWENLSETAVLNVSLAFTSN